MQMCTHGVQKGRRVGFVRDKESRTKYEVATRINGRQVFLPAPYKRKKPTKCELCEKSTEMMGYHCWDHSKPSRGIWACYGCHMLVERWEKGGADIIAKYLILKDIIDDEMGGLA